ncbi:tRNase Z TRZ2, chloroplastic isoform X4 [Camellia sinensis]|uniref:tRNase Z TRZ2, chloroplastic isoform X3 n=1 Tax=Camellia sinensis TaxID=4442 RepID=UPI001035729D|nr:tRNase Z TRZ2, chloroplastic isoform X3 [Camellia sinensis]XP_028054095.1 tRNase Z TRZ2, chloroplastic isoform X4 [Camellia sinensis]
MMQLSVTISTSSSFPSFSPSQQPTQNPPPPLPPAIERPKKPKHHTLRVNQHHHQHHVGPLHALKGTGFLSAIGQAIEEEEYRKARAEVNRKGFNLEGYSIEGVSIGGHETCVIVPELKSAFDIGRCPSRAVNQNFVFITHAHLDHIGGLPMYVATRGLYNLKPPTVFVPPCLKEDVEKLFDIHRTMSQVELNLDLVTLDVGETYEMRNNLVVRPFKTHHVIPSQGYVIYSVRKKLRKQYMHLNGKQIEKLKKSGVEITDTILSPEVAFTGDTMSDFFLDPRSADALRAKILITEATFLDEGCSIEHAREHGHTHLFEIIEHAQWIRNKAVLLTHFSPRYNIELRTWCCILSVLRMHLIEFMPSNKNVGCPLHKFFNHAKEHHKSDGVESFS